jgi:isopentenyl-diphosphate delta-isomerase
MKEVVVLITEDNQIIGTMEKYAAHNKNTQLHRAFSCYVFNEKGQFLLTQRAKSKKVFPGVWTNSCCGHPGLGESHEHALKRRLLYELGLQPDMVQLALVDFRYRAEMNGIVENELCPVYLVKVSQNPTRNPEEVETYKWMSWKSFLKKTRDNPKGYSKWCVMQVEELEKIRAVEKFLQ